MHQYSAVNENEPSCVGGGLTPHSSRIASASASPSRSTPETFSEKPLTQSLYWRTHVSLAKMWTDLYTQ